MIRRVRLVNFLSHRDTEIVLGEGLTVFIGRNGAGKSSVVDAIVYALYGQHTRGQNANVARDGSPGGRVELELEVGGRVYQVLREFDGRGGLRAASVRSDGALLAVGERRDDRRVSEAVAGLLGMDYERMRSSVLIQQGEIDAILRADPRELKRLFDDLLGLSAFERAYEAMRDVLEGFAERVRRMTGRPLDQASSVERELQDLREGLERDRAREACLRSELDGLRKRYDELSGRIARLEELERLVSQARTALELVREAVRREVRNVEEKLGKLEGFLGLLSVRGEAESRVRRIEELRRQQAVLEERAKQLQRQIQEAEERLRQLPRGFQAARTLDELREEALRRAERLRDDAVELGKAIASGSDAKELAERVETDVDGVVELVSEAYSSAIASWVAELVRSRDAWRSELEEVRAVLRDVGLEIGRLSTLMGVDIGRLHAQLQVAEQEVERAGGEEGVSRLRATLGELKRVRDALDRLNGPLDLDASTLSRLEGLRENLQLDLPVESLRRLSSLVQQLRQEGVTGEELEELGKLRSQREELSRSIGKTEQELMDLRRRVEEAEERIGELESVRDVLRRAKEFHELMRRVRDQVYHREGPVLRSLRSWVYGRVSDRAREYLDALDSPVSEVRIEEESSGRASRVVFRCFHHGREVSWERLSGGEKVVLALALRLAIGDVLGAQRLGFFVLDEPTVHLDAEKRRRLRDVLTRLGRKLPQVVVITHDEEVFEGSEARVLRFELEGGVTEVGELQAAT